MLLGMIVACVPKLRSEQSMPRDGLRGVFGFGRAVCVCEFNPQVWVQSPAVFSCRISARGQAQIGPAG